MNKGPRGKAIWDIASVTLYCDLCIVEVEAGCCPGTHFTKLGWNNLIVNFNKETGREYTKLQLKNKWDALKSDWKLWKQLIGKETRLGWNPQLKTIDASEEWWLSKLEVHPGASKFRKEGIDVEMKVKLDKMFMNITATGDYAWTPSSGILPSNDCQILDDDHVIPLDPSGEVNNSIQIKSEDGEGLEKENKRNLEEDDKQAIKKEKGLPNSMVITDDENVVICATAHILESYYLKYIYKQPCMNSIQTDNMWMHEIIQGNENRCHRMFRMEKHVFLKLCVDLEAKYGLKGLINMNSIEILGMCLHILGHGVGNRLAQERFQHSGETMSRYFSQMLDIFCLLAIDIIKPMDPEFKDIPEEILRDSRYMPHFKMQVGKVPHMMQGFS
ncbi:hypothetical protein Ddye_021574 [Dipteronia dyeriana]|uniref:Myb/SANT-like domain-containing protein n=1 Tax=Dipteronia dyeriana TaxID=168575 RepID=A0AAD9WWF8_9ROSI|nr:hypothetical protein Ddye_021574 [Dipteronia dyeriana]